MKKRKYILTLLSFLTFSAVGCTTEHTDLEEIPTPTIEISTEKFTPTPTIENNSNKNTATSTPKPTTSAIFSSGKPKIVVQTKGLCEVLEKKDSSLQEYYAKYNSFNRMLSQMEVSGFAGNSLFCIDESTGVIYFVNQGKDYYLYRLKDGEVELVVDMPVKEVYPYNDSVYFMIEDYGKYELEGMNNGDIYCYTPADGTIQLIYEIGVPESKTHKFVIKEEGIYFSYEIIKNETSSSFYNYYLPVGEITPIVDTKVMTWKGWNDYFFSYSNGFVLQSRTRQSDGTRETIPLSASRGRYCVVGDNLYSANKTSVSCINLNTGEEKKYSFEKIIEEVRGAEILEQKGVEIIDKFTVTEEDIWVEDGFYLYRFHLQNEELSYYRIIDNDKTLHTIENLYTDGEQLYVLGSLATTEKRQNILMRVLPENVVEDSMQEPSLKVEYITE